jgi:hypothetical protein
MSEDATGTSGQTLAFKEVTGIKQVSEKLPWEVKTILQEPYSVLAFLPLSQQFQLLVIIDLFPVITYPITVILCTAEAQSI